MSKRKGLKEYKLYGVLKKYFTQKLTYKQLKRNIKINLVYVVLTSGISGMVFAVSSEYLVLIVPCFVNTMLLSVALMDIFKIVEQSKEVFSQ